MKKAKYFRIIEQLDTDKFVVELNETDELPNVRNVKVQHDYVEIEGVTSMFIDHDKCSLIQGHVCANVVSHVCSIQIPILPFYQVVLPYLNNHKYLKPEHVFSPRFDDNNRPIPNSFNYDYSNSIFRIYDSNRKEYMYHVRLKGETEFNVVTEKFYKTYIESTL